MSLYLVLTLLIASRVSSVAGQSNYADQANNIEYQGEGLPEQATLDGKVTKLDDLSPVIFLNRTKAALNCAAGSMQVELKFNDRFYGAAYADFDRNSACRVFGKGDYSYKIELPLKGCGTKQDPQRVFTNNIVVRFHPSLEIDGDEIITIVCRYPPPVAPIPAPLPPPNPEKTILEPALAPPLKGFQILLIICGILFLSLLLLGLGCSYYCLRNRNMTVIRKHPLPSIGSGSEITKLSGSSLGNLSMFEGLKIPRIQAQPLAAASSSESHSELDEHDNRSLPVSSAGSYENKTYVHESGSFYSESYGHTQEQHIQNAVATSATVPRLPLAVKEQPKFDVQVRVKKPPPSPPSLSDAESSVIRTERNLTTILEQREESVRSIESPLPLPPPPERSQFVYVPELHPPPKHIQPAPTYNRILRRQQELHHEERSIASLNTEMTDTHSMTEILDDSHHIVAPAPPPPPPPIIGQEQYVLEMERSSVEAMIEPPIAAIHKPEITSHVVDDVFLRTITEKKTIEDIERHKRLITEYHTRAKPLPEQHWDVTIKNYPIEMPEPPEWENFSDISSASGLTLTPKPERVVMSLPPQNTIDDNKLPLNSPELVGNIGHHHETFLSTFKIPYENPQVPNWNILIRVLQPDEQDDNASATEMTEMLNTPLTMADKMKWRQIITTESTLRTLLTEAVVREDFERIRHDSRYEKLFEPPKWDVIIRILTPVDKPRNQMRFKKKSDWDNRSRRSSLPTLYEYDSDGGSSMRTLTQDANAHPLVPLRSRRTSRSSYRSEADLRSMSEMTVDFGRPDHGDNQSESSSYYPGVGQYYDDSELDVDYKTVSHHPSLARSLSQPSLARSASEFTERWVAPSSRYDTASEFTSPEVTPKSQRSTRIRDAAEHSATWQVSPASPAARGGRASHVVTQQYRSEATTSFMGPSTSSRGWYGDGYSDAGYK